MLPGASAARTRRHSPSAVSSDVFRRGSCRSDHTPDRQVRSVVKRTGAAMPAALFPVLPLPEKAAGMGYCRHEKDLPALRLYDRSHFSRLEIELSVNSWYVGSNPTLSAIFCKPLIFRGLFCELAAARIHRLASRITSPLECAFVPLRQAALAARPAQTPQSWDHSHARGKNACERRTHGVIA